MISIHAPREGSDDDRVQAGLVDDGISIYAPREGSDLAYLYFLPAFAYFYPRSP